MRALYWNGRTLSLEHSHPAPTTDRRMAMIKVRLAGICSTDLQIFRGYMGFRGVPGHEFVGEVCEGPDSLAGRRIVGEINFACGFCDFCSRSLERHCPNRQVMGILGANGSFAEYTAVPVENLHLVPDTVSDEDAVFTEPLAAAFEILEQVEIYPYHEVLVLGDGKLGLLSAQVLSATGARVTVVGKHERKLRLLAKRGIATFLLSDWRRGFFDVAIEATGSSQGLELALAAVRPRGTVVLKSTLATDHSLALAAAVINEVTIVGSRCGPFAPALQALREKTVSVNPLIERSYPLSRGLDAVAHAARSGTLKVLLRNGD